MKKVLPLLILAAVIGAVFVLSLNNAQSEQKKIAWWKFQSIDTMKYSRDVAREKLNDPSFDKEINEQVKQIAETGATHVAIATPYDEEFYPMLKRWTDAARRNNLKVWFRGNWSGWEGWFEYPEISRAEHIQKTDEFIRKHRDLFEDGDVFSACPECENGGTGDPRHNGDLAGHRRFLIDEYAVTKKGFKAIGKDVQSNLHSMNGDVARLVMNKETTKALDGIVTIDHYVSTPEKLVADIKEFSRSSGGKIVLGEFGAPIPDIHGYMSEEEQALWIKSAVSKLIEMPEVVGMNYWTNKGSSTELWEGDGESRLAVKEITAIYNAPIVKVEVKDETGSRVKDADLTLEGTSFVADQNGDFYLPYLEELSGLEINASGYLPTKTNLQKTEEMEILLRKENEGFLFRLRKFIKNLF